MIFGGFEWVLIVLTILFLFGAKRIPEFARGLGQGINEFRKTSESLKKSRQEIRDSLKYEESDKEDVDKQFSEQESEQEPNRKTGSQEI